MADRHREVADKIEELLTDNLSGFPYDEIRVRDYVDSEPLSEGITISPTGETELTGTNERDDIEYVTTIVRSTHALNSDDLSQKSHFRDQLRRIFHHKRINIDNTCVTYNRMETGQFAIPEAWTRNNNSVTVVRIMSTVRESRDNP